MSYHNFYELDVWKQARHFKRRIYEVIKLFPHTERFGLASQLSRAAASVPANLAEGHGRQTVKDELHFCIMARGSLSEIQNHLIDAKDRSYLSDEMLLQLKLEWDKTRRILNGYIAFQRSRISPGNSENGEVHETDQLYNADEAVFTPEDPTDFHRNLARSE